MVNIMALVSKGEMYTIVGSRIFQAFIELDGDSVLMFIQKFPSLREAIAKGPNIAIRMLALEDDENEYSIEIQICNKHKSNGSPCEYEYNLSYHKYIEGPSMDSFLEVCEAIQKDGVYDYVTTNDYLELFI